MDDPRLAAHQLLVAVATYNEMENLPRLVDAIFQSLPEADLLVVDDNSPDGTGRWCDTRASGDARIHCLHRPEKLGLGTATLAALEFAMKHGYRYVINLDADFSHAPSDLPRLLAAIEQAESPVIDVVIGSRYVPGGEIRGWPFWRHLMSRAVNTYARWVLGLPCRDCSGAFRSYRVERLKSLDFDGFYSSGYSVLEELLWRLQRVGARFQEIPIVFTNRQRGVSKINAREALAALWIILRLAVNG
ncbi:MAG: polyprenol monophosphomannose synthase [Pirellulales bacterium]